MVVLRYLLGNTETVVLIFPKCGGALFSLVFLMAAWVWVVVKYWEQPAWWSWMWEGKGCAAWVLHSGSFRDVVEVPWASLCCCVGWAGAITPWAAGGPVWEIPWCPWIKAGWNQMAQKSSHQEVSWQYLSPIGRIKQDIGFRAWRKCVWIMWSAPGNYNVPST